MVRLLLLPPVLPPMQSGRADVACALPPCCEEELGHNFNSPHTQVRSSTASGHAAQHMPAPAAANRWLQHAANGSPRHARCTCMRRTTATLEATPTQWIT